jgi:hypothetical protein
MGTPKLCEAVWSLEKLESVTELMKLFKAESGEEDVAIGSKV